MRTFTNRFATGVATAALLACLAPCGGRAETRNRDPHAHRNGPHQTLPWLPGDPRPNTSTAAPSAMPAVPTQAPPPPVLPPPLVVPIRKPEPPLPPTVLPDAAGGVDHLKDGLRLTFGAGSADLNPETDGAIRALARSEPPDRTTFSVAAHALPTPDDPSTARRLSLSRALAVRAALIESGIASPHIYVRALGGSEPPPPGVTPDRVDIVVTVASPAAAPAQAAPPEKAAP